MPVRKRLILAAAFATVLLVIALSAAAVWRQSSRIRNQVASLHQTHKQAGDALTAIRGTVFLSAILTRDYLLDADASRSAEYIEQFDDLKESAERSFSLLRSVADREGRQREALDRLHREIEEYWDPTEIALDWSPEERAMRRIRVLRQRVGKRAEIFTLASRVESLLAENFEREQKRIARAERDFQGFLAWSTGFTICLTAIIAAVTLFRISRLERQSREAETELRQLSAQLRTTQEEERRSLARELHDEVGQMLTGLRMELTGIARQFGGRDGEIAERIERVKGSVERTLRTVRNIAMMLRPSMLDDLGLAPAIAWQVKEFTRVSGISASAHVDPELDALPDRPRTCLYRMVQEGLTNCGRHARASEVSVDIRRTGTEVRAVVSDNGQGFNPAAKRAGAMGLLGLEERIRELGGTLTISSSPGSGTRLEARMPMPAEVPMPAEQSTDDTGTDRGRSRDREGRAKASA